MSHGLRGIVQPVSHTVWSFAHVVLGGALESKSGIGSHDSGALSLDGSCVGMADASYYLALGCTRAALNHTPKFIVVVFFVAVLSVVGHYSTARKQSVSTVRVCGGISVDRLKAGTEDSESLIAISIVIISGYWYKTLRETVGMAES